MKDRYRVKSRSIPNRGAPGTMKEYYLYDNQNKQSTAYSSVIESDIEKLAVRWNGYEELREYNMQIKTDHNQLTLENFKEAIKKKPFPLRACSICDHMMYIFYKNEAFWFNSTCNCVRYTSPDQYYSDDDLKFYLNPDHGHIERIKKFIGETNEKENTSQEV
jgi:hypothetical protein